MRLCASTRFGECFAVYLNSLLKYSGHKSLRRIEPYLDAETGA